MSKPFSLTHWKEMKSDEQGSLIQSLLTRIEVLEAEVGIGQDEDEGDGEDEGGTTPEEFGIVTESSSSVVDSNNSIVLTVKTFGDVAALKVNHNYSKDGSYGDILPKFTIYANESDVWGDPQSTSAANSLGVVVTYNAAEQEFTLTIEHDGQAMTDISNIGGDAVEFYIRPRNSSEVVNPAVTISTLG